MNLSFKNRIAVHYMIATAIVVAVVFGIVFFIVKSTVYQNLDNDLSFEAIKHSKIVRWDGDSLYFINKREWEEREHTRVQVNPVFIQVLNRNGKLMDKSPNLKDQQLPFVNAQKFGDHFDAQLNSRAIRQVQLPIEEAKGDIKGYIVAAMSLESSNMVIQKLSNVLLISYPIVLMGLFFISRYIAGRSIIPVNKIIETTNRITKNNLNERVALPSNKGELYVLTSSINELLTRIQNAINRERQFTSDASHELRTPLSSLRGTLEILIRKPRKQEEYEEKVRYSLSEIDRMTATVEQLLLLARFDANTNSNQREKVALPTIVDDILSRYNSAIKAKKLGVVFNAKQTDDALVPPYCSTLILDNVINNAIKYSKEKGKINISVEKEEEKLICEVRDEGIGIREEEIENLFNPFYRSDALNHKSIGGNGLGLSIAKKAADAIQANLVIESGVDRGTSVKVVFKTS